MTGWNLPPGCNVSDIPGNRPEDEAWENLCQDFYSAITEKEWKKIEGVTDIIEKAIEYGIEAGKKEQHLIEEENRFYEQQAKERGESVDEQDS